MPPIPRPLPDEYPAYADMYLRRVPGDDALDALERQTDAVRSLFRSLPADRLGYRYAPGKWTPREILLHLADDERIYAYRALRFARGDQTELPGFDQDPYAAASGAEARQLETLLAEHAAVRQATLALFRHLPEEALIRRGVANGAPVTVRALAWHIAGHELHHLAILRERYSA